MEIAGASPLGWILFFAFAVFCGFAAFYLVYGAARVFEGNEGSDRFSTWLLDHRTPIVVVTSIISVVVMVVAALNVAGRS